jgi:nitroimidazol reductase NimA-like FMN-containing flavoprotein (pyridoxamine 5'-phosphate oxidase superfamily)
MEVPLEFKTRRTTLLRRPDRGSHDFADIAAILDEALICHMGFADADGQPFVIPTVFGRDGRALYIHGSAAGRTPRTLASGVPICFTASIIDGLIYARSAFKNSINYRSVMVLGHAAEVTGDEKLHAFRVITEHTMPGRWAEIRLPNDGELDATAVLRLEINEASAKIRTGGPADNDEDLARPIWAGVLPLSLVPGEPIAHEAVPPDMPLPPYLAPYRRPR